MVNKSGVPISRLREMLEYNPLTGQFVWLQKPAKRIHVGDVAGCIQPDGYVRLTLDRSAFPAHRAAWAYVHGVWPNCEIDHVNRHPADNRIANLRLASHSENMQNIYSPHRRQSRSGYRGVGWSGQKAKWRARINIENREVHLGFFDSADEAAAVYARAKSELHPFAVRS